jgi:hypothetical protein
MRGKSSCSETSRVTRFPLTDDRTGTEEGKPSPPGPVSLPPGAWTFRNGLWPELATTTNAIPLRIGIHPPSCLNSAVVSWSCVQPPNPGGAARGVGSSPLRCPSSPLSTDPFRRGARPAPVCIPPLGARRTSESDSHWEAPGAESATRTTTSRRRCPTTPRSRLEGRQTHPGGRRPGRGTDNVRGPEGSQTLASPHPSVEVEAFRVTGRPSGHPSPRRGYSSVRSRYRPIASARFTAPTARRMALTWLLTVGTPTTRRSAICAFDNPSSISSSVCR